MLPSDNPQKPLYSTVSTDLPGVYCTVGRRVRGYSSETSDLIAKDLKEARIRITRSGGKFAFGDKSGLSVDAAGILLRGYIEPRTKLDWSVVSMNSMIRHIAALNELDGVPEQQYKPEINEVPAELRTWIFNNVLTDKEAFLSFKTLGEALPEGLNKHRNRLTEAISSIFQINMERTRIDGVQTRGWWNLSLSSDGENDEPAGSTGVVVAGASPSSPPPGVSFFVKPKTENPQ